MKAARFRLGAFVVLALVAVLTGAIQQAGAVGATPPSLTVGTAPLDPTPGTDVTITATAVPGTVPASTGLAVNCDLSWIGLGASAPLTPDAAGLIFTRQFTIPAATVPGTRVGSCGVSDDQGRSSSATYSVNVVPGATTVAPTVTSHTPDDGETNVALGANIGIVFSVPVDTTGSWFTINCDGSGAHAAGVSGGPTSFVLDPTTDFDNGESCTVTLDGSHIADQSDPANTLAGSPAWTFVTVVSPTDPSGFGAAVPSTVTAGESTLLSVTVTPGSNPASTGLAVAADLSAIGGSSGQQFYDDGTHGDVAAGDGVFSFSATVDPGTAPGSLGLPAAITDAQGRSAPANISLTVTAPPTNAPPTVSAGGPYTVDEGGSVDLAATGSDPENGPLTYAWDLDGNGTYETSGQNVSFSALGLDGPASRTVGVEVTDEGGLTGTDVATVNIANVAPSVTAPSGQSTSEGTPATISLGSFADPGGSLDAPYGVAIAWGDGSSPSTASASSPGTLGTAIHTFDDNGTYHVTVTVTDKDAASGSATFDVTVNNVAPTATFEAPTSAPAGFPFTLSLTNQHDPSAADTAAGFTYAFDCGSGYGAFGSSNSSSCPTTDTGTRLVGGKIRDKDGGVTEYRASVRIFVTFDSLCDLVRAYSADPKVADDLCDKLVKAAGAPTDGAHAGMLGAFRNQVDAKIGKGLTAQQAAELKLLSTRL